MGLQFILMSKEKLLWCNYGVIITVLTNADKSAYIVPSYVFYHCHAGREGEESDVTVLSLLILSVWNVGRL